jgi:hypothetical protein
LGETTIGRTELLGDLVVADNYDEPVHPHIGPPQGRWWMPHNPHRMNSTIDSCASVTEYKVGPVPTPGTHIPGLLAEPV